MNKYYDEIKLKIKDLVERKNFELALSIINDELSMPYIPMDFEKFLLSKINEIPIKDNDSFEISLNKILDLLSKVTDNDFFMIDIINLLNKFNLNIIKEEIIEFMNKINSKRIKALVYEELIKQKFDYEFEFGNPLKSKLIEQDEMYLLDIKMIENKLLKYSSLLPQAYLLLKDIYLVKYFGEKINEEQWDVVIFALARIFNDDNLLKMIKNFKKIQTKLESFKTINNL